MAEIIGTWENKQASIGLFMDLSKTFDCLEQAILPKELVKYGVSGPLLPWISSYPSFRNQRVEINGSILPQGL